VIQDLLNFLYELDYKVSRLREMRRVRAGKNTSEGNRISLSTFLSPRMPDA
jgi:hypothetical protein